MLRPVISWCIDRGLKIQDFTDVAKLGFAREADARLKREQGAYSTSKISIMTGIQRPEVNRLLAESVHPRPKDIITRVVGRWAVDKRFTTRKGEPRPLAAHGSKSEFFKLVYLVSTDLNPHTIRFELERLGLVKIEGDKIFLLRSDYLSQGDPAETFLLGAEDSSDLQYAVQENVAFLNTIPNLHGRTSYNNIADEHVPMLRSWLLDLGSRIHKECREILSKYDRDLNPDLPPGNGRNRVVLGTFSRVEEIQVDTQVGSKGEEVK